MSWYMPSYGRPERLRTMLEAPGGWPPVVYVMVNQDDPERVRYEQIKDALWHDWEAKGPADRGLAPPWYIQIIPAGSRCADAHRLITDSALATEPFYGLLCDDHWPITPGWWQEMEKAAGDKYIAASNGSPQFPLIRSAVCFGGKLVQAMGSLVPAPMKHNFEDNLWDQIAADFGLLRPLKDVVVEHRHWTYDLAERDKTYIRGSEDYARDEQLFREWLDSDQKREVYDRIGKMLGIKTIRFNPEGIRLAIITPVQECHVDLAYHSSMINTVLRLQSRGLKFLIQQEGGGSHIGKAREGLLWKAYYTDPKPTHIMFIDADMGWDPDLIPKLLATGKEFVAVPGVKKQGAFAICANFFPGEQIVDPEDGFLEVDGVGMAFVMLKTEVIDKMMQAYPELRYEAPRPEYALFADLLEDGKRLSEDYSFCGRWRKLGGAIWVDPNARLIHAGRKEYTGAVRDLAEAA